jgi:FHA domain
MPDVSYVPGRLIAVAGERCVALVEAAPGSVAATWIWERVASGASAQALLAGLLGAGFDGVGGFALLDRGPAGPRRLFCRDPVGALVEGGSAPARVDGAGLLTWREHVAGADAERVVLGERPGGNAFLLPAAAGVQLAGCVIVDLVGAPARDTARDTSRYDLAAAGYATIDTFNIASRGSAPDAAAAAPADAGGDGDDIAGEATRPPLSWPLPVPRDARPDPAPAPQGLIDAVQWGAGPGATVASTTRRPPLAGAAPLAEVVPLAEEAEAGELTVGRASLAEQAALSAPPDRIGPAVPALICPVGHVNPPSEAACRKCGAPLPNDTVIVPRPVLGVLRLSTGDMIMLDRDVVMGRNPRADFAGDDGEDRPHVVKLPSADGDISRTHLRVTLDGWHVLVTDLNSTNGTLVTLPGRDPEQLRRGETVPIRLGTVVTLTEDIDFRYEVPE